MKTRLLMLTAIFNALFGTAIAGQGEKVSYPAPVVSGINQDGATVNFADVYKKGPTVVFFYPKADTPGCTKQACSLRDAYADLTGKGVKVFGVSVDPVKAQKAFKDKFQLPFELLADEDGKVIAAFGVPKTMGFAKRQAYLFKDGKLVWRDLAAATEQQAADVLRVIAAKPQ